MLLMAVIKPCETSMPKQQLGGCDNLMAGLDVSHGFMPVMILVFYYLFEVFLLSMFLKLKSSRSNKKAIKSEANRLN